MTEPRGAVSGADAMPGRDGDGSGAAAPRREIAGPQHRDEGGQPIAPITRLADEAYEDPRPARISCWPKISIRWVTPGGGDHRGRSVGIRQTQFQVITARAGSGWQTTLTPEFAPYHLTIQARRQRGI
jgi:hypothetical protein